MKRSHRKFLAVFLLGALTYGLYYFLWGQHLYLVTAYCNCPICINVKEVHDGRFASNRKVYWGGIAADPSMPFGTEVELVPHAFQDQIAIEQLLQGRKSFIVEDRGGKIKGKHIDLFIPDEMGGHKAAKKWGARRMRIKVNQKLA